MSWITGSSTSHIDFLNDLIAAATGQGMTSVDSIANGGSGYTVGDVLTLSGGTFSHAGKLEVLTVSSGAVTSVRIQEAGSYTSPPSDPVSVTGGTGTGATFNLTFASNGWTQLRRSQEGVSATVQSGGSGYTNGDLLTGVGGVGVTTAAVFQVTGVSGGAVTTVTLQTAGLYEVVPANPVATTGGTGTGCTLNVTWQNPATQEQVAILQGSGAGSDTILVGVRTYNVLSQDGLNTAYNLALVGFTGYNASLTFNNQPGVSPGAGVSATTGAYVPMHNNGGSFPITWGASITSRRIAFFAKVANATVTHYVSGYLGLLNPFGTTSEFPYPIYIAGSTSRHNSLFAHTDVGRVGGIVECIGLQVATGPAFYFRVDSVWQEVKNSQATDTGAPTRAVDNDFTVYPAGQSQLNATVDDQIVGSAEVEWDDVIPNSGIPGSAQNTFKATPDSGGAQHPLIPCTLVSSQGSFYDVEGELDGVFWTSAGDGESSEDRILVGNDRYRMFQQGNRALAFTFGAIKES